jgi:hypothetical protein
MAPQTLAAVPGKRAGHEPLFDIHPFFVCGEPQPDGKTFHLWARDHEGALAMDATATLAKYVVSTGGGIWRNLGPPLSCKHSGGGSASVTT